MFDISADGPNPDSKTKIIDAYIQTNSTTTVIYRDRDIKQHMYTCKLIDHK